MVSLQMMRLDEYDREEWWDVCRALRRGITREEFLRMWDEFVIYKETRQTQKVFQ